MDIMNEMDIRDLMKEKGLKITTKRLGILRVLSMLENPVDVLKLKERLDEFSIDVNLSTIYRALESMAESTLVNRLMFSGDSRVFYEMNRSVHRHYLHCLGCKELVPLDVCPLKDYQANLAQSTNYMLVGHHLDIYGYCPKCQEKK